MAKQNPYSREGYLLENYRYFHLRDTAGQERDFHFHEFDKLVLLLSGRVDYFVEGITYSLRPRDILLVKHHTIHKALIDKSVPYDRVIIYLDRKYFDRVMPEAKLCGCFDTADMGRSYLLSPEEAQWEPLSRCLEQYEASRDDGQYAAQPMRDTLIMQLLIHINRICAASPAHGGGENISDEKIARALSYINENLTGELSVDTLSEQVYLSRYHFMRLFKAQTGSTVHAYIRQKRLLHAARLIREGVSASRAAAESGFSDYSAFHRAFRESFGMSPGELKK